ncbi:hypothetical protein [Nonomuraea harbinensis]|uniref:Uncharacterized protein n=1 Tax=Nonomuraea harbinensis TaxID=1286938 RepID=A0ABW1C0N4_9ACTN|nr:hypothetical protein [Nonomuraea harbinensis]
MRACSRWTVTWQAPAVWLLLGLLLLATLIARTVRVVGEDERLVVRRLGRVTGVRGPASWRPSRTRSASRRRWKAR